MLDSSNIEAKSPEKEEKIHKMHGIILSGKELSEGKINLPEDSQERLAKIKNKEAFFDTVKNNLQTLKREKKLKVIISTKLKDFPEDKNFKSKFKYMYSWDEIKEKIQKGKKIYFSLILKESMVIGWGYAIFLYKKWDIKIIDVDLASRRMSGIYKEFSINGEEFQVGVGHLIVYDLIKKLRGAIITDANNGNSQYIFKSLGFIPYANNPCLLKLER